MFWSLRLRNFLFMAIKYLLWDNILIYIYVIHYQVWKSYFLQMQSQMDYYFNETLFGWKTNLWIHDLYVMLIEIF